jgi:hypothetical protein
MLSSGIVLHMAELKYFARVVRGISPTFEAGYEKARVRIDGQIGYVRRANGIAIQDLPPTGFGGQHGPPEFDYREYIEVEMRPGETGGTTMDLGGGWKEVSEEEFSAANSR